MRVRNEKEREAKILVFTVELGTKHFRIKRNISFFINNDDYIISKMPFFLLFLIKASGITNKKV